MLKAEQMKEYFDGDKVNFGVADNFEEQAEILIDFVYIVKYFLKMSIKNEEESGIGVIGYMNRMERAHEALTSLIYEINCVLDEQESEGE